MKKTIKQKAHKYRVVEYKDGLKQFRWKVIHKNGNIICSSSEGYKTSRGMRNSLNRLLEGIYELDYEREAQF